jgi:hypothetical protein
VRSNDSLLEMGATHQRLDMEEEHANYAMTGFVEPEEIDQRILSMSSERASWFGKRFITYD